MKTISKKSFLKIIDFIRERNDKEVEIQKLFKEEFTDAIFYPYCKYENLLVNLLEELMEDQETNWISYYCWEKDFGRDETLEVFDKEGNKIPLSTAEDLWNMIND